MQVDVILDICAAQVAQSITGAFVQTYTLGIRLLTLQHIHASAQIFKRNIRLSESVRL